MLRISIGIDPVVAHLGPFMLRWYSLAVTTAIAVAAVVTYREFLRKGLPIAGFDALLLWTVVGGIAGARLFHVLDHPERFLGDPPRILAVQEGGLAIYGAVVGGLVALLLASRRPGYAFLPLIDAAVPGLLLAQAIGRIGCLVNGDAWGAPTTGPLALVYTSPRAFLPPDLLGVPTHPYPIYDMALNLAVFAGVWRLRRCGLPDGALFALFTVLCASVRFVISFVRQERIWLWGCRRPRSPPCWPSSSGPSPSSGCCVAGRRSSLSR